MQINTDFGFFFFFKVGVPPSVAGSRTGSHPSSTDVDLQHRDGLMAGAQAHTRQRATDNIKGTLSKGTEVCFLRVAFLPPRTL